MLSLPERTVLATHLHNYFKHKDSPPADQVIVPADYIRPVKEDDSTYTAIVKFIVYWCNDNKKTNTIKVRFKVDQTGRFLANSWAYV